MMNPGNLTVTTPSDRVIQMTRVFNAPRQLVFDAMTKPELLKRWFYGPDGWSLAVCEIDLQAGGMYRYVWLSPDGTEMGMGGIIKEVVRPERIVQTEKFDQAWYPGEAVGTMLLFEDNGKTTLTLTVEYDSKETRDAVLKTPMAEGVAMGYNRLAEMLPEFA
ncbi:MAG: SRPBCC family protein [Bryobacteraceae bacterium]